MAEHEIEVSFENAEIEAIFEINAVTFDYEQLDKKPQINGVTLIGDKSSADLHIASEQALLDEIENRQDADVEINNNLSELDAKVDGINANLTQQIEETKQDVNDKYNELVNDIDAEIQAREQADTTINQRITDVADELQQSIEENVVALQQEDTALQNQINAHSQTLTAYDTRITNNSNAISQETTNRQNADEDLQTQITVNAEKIEELTVARFPNVVIIGTPHIEGGQVSNYSDANYLQFPFVDISRGLPFDIYFSFTTSNDVTTQQNILDSYFGIALAIQNGKGIMALSSNGTGWDIGTSTGTNTLLPNTTYYVKYSWTGSAYSASLSLNETEYIPDMNLTSSLSPHKTTIFIGGSPNLFGPNTAHPFKGTINFNKSKVVVNGLTVWEGMADVGLASRANVSLNNLDEVGEMRFNNKQDVIQDLATIRNGASLGATALQSIPSNYVTNTNYATTSIGGVIKTALTAGSSVDNNGVLQSVIRTQQQYNTDANVMFISKGTLENIKQVLVTSVADAKYQLIGDYATNTALTSGLASKQDVLDITLLEGAVL